MSKENTLNNKNIDKKLDLRNKPEIQQPKPQKKPINRHPINKPINSHNPNLNNRQIRDEMNPKPINNRPNKSFASNIDKGIKNKPYELNNRKNTNDSKLKNAKLRKPPIKIIPLGGLNEIGKNMTCYEYDNNMFIVDCGLAFPDPDMLGVDIVIPDFTYVEKNRQKLRAVILTHGHEDHIGGLAYFLKRFNVPVYGTRLTIGLVEGKLKEHNILSKCKLNVINPGQSIAFSCFDVEFIHVNHSIPDAVSLAITTPVGTIIQTGDFKVDYQPIHGDVINIARFAELGKKGVLCLLSDSTNAERPGSTISERKVGNTLERLFQECCKKRIIVATFASNIHRVQQIIDSAVKFGRKVAVSGRSMINIVNKSLELGYLNIPEKVLIDIDATHHYNSEQIVVITTGSQGEPMSALSRMAACEHKKIRVSSNDCIIISASPIPGNEKYVNKVINDLMKQGANVISKHVEEIHVSGHAFQDELKLMLSLTKPKYFIPVHGEYRHLRAHANLATSMNFPESNIHIGYIGNVIAIDNVDMRILDSVPAGKTLVDGLGVGDVGSIVLRDRKHLAEDGLIVVVATIENEYGTIVSGPDIVSRGFVYIRESEQLIENAKRIVKEVLDDCSNKNIREWGTIKLNIKYSLSEYIYRKTKRSPMLLPIIMEI